MPNLGPPPQPPQRPGETRVPLGRWNDRALADLRAAAAAASGPALTWSRGPFGQVAQFGGKVVGNVHRGHPDHPWVAVLTGFEWWTEPSKIIPRWHYSPPRAFPSGLRDAKKAIALAIQTSLVCNETREARTN